MGHQAVEAGCPWAGQWLVVILVPGGCEVCPVQEIGKQKVGGLVGIPVGCGWRGFQLLGGG